MIFATWNVRSLQRAAAFGKMTEELIRCNVDLCAIQEIRWPGDGILNKNTGILYYSGSSKNGNQFGTGISVNKELNNKVTDFQDINSRICKLRLRLKPYNITIISAHALTEDKSENEKEVFYEELEKLYDQTRGLI